MRYWGTEVKARLEAERRARALERVKKERQRAEAWAASPAGRAELEARRRREERRKSCAICGRPNGTDAAWLLWCCSAACYDEECVLRGEREQARRQGVSVAELRRRLPPRRVYVPHGRKPPAGVIWGDGAVDYHARPRRFSRSLGGELEAEPARLDELREVIRMYLQGRSLGSENWGYYRGRRLACPYRCAPGSPSCPVDVLVQEINQPSAWADRARAGRLAPSVG